MSGISRRNRIDLQTPTEAAIRAAMRAVEDLSKRIGDGYEEAYTAARTWLRARLV